MDGVGMVKVRCFKNSGITRHDIAATVIIKNNKVRKI